MVKKRFILALFVFSTLFQAGLADKIRDNSLKTLKSRGFVVAPNLPQSASRGHLKLRPQKEIEARFEALHAYIAWVAFPPGVVDDEAFRREAQEGKWRDWLTKEERDVFRLTKAKAKEKYLEDVGWQMENLWSLAWVLGYLAEPALSGEIGGELAQDLVFNFAIKGKRRLRSADEVIQLEDRFYCAHSAVRRAQQGDKTIPKNFHAINDGGGILERRHSLTWCLSPGVSWDETNLSTQ